MSDSCQSSSALLVICAGLIIIHEHVFQLVESGSTPESLNGLAQEVAADFNTNCHQQWAHAVEKQSWQFKRRKDIVSQLTGLIMEHLMVSTMHLHLFVSC